MSTPRASPSMSTPNTLNLTYSFTVSWLLSTTSTILKRRYIWTEPIRMKLRSCSRFIKMPLNVDINLLKHDWLKSFTFLLKQTILWKFPLNEDLASISFPTSLPVPSSSNAFIPGFACLLRGKLQIVRFRIVRFSCNRYERDTSQWFAKGTAS